MNIALVYKVVALVLILGGLNVGLMGAFHYDAIEAVGGTGMVHTVVDIIIGVAAIITFYAVFIAKKVY